MSIHGSKLRGGLIVPVINWLCKCVDSILLTTLSVGEQTNFPDDDECAKILFIGGDRDDLRLRGGGFIGFV